MKPIDAKTEQDIVALGRDNIETQCGLGWMLNPGYVSLHFGAGKWLKIPRTDLDQFVRWYTGESP